MSRRETGTVRDPVLPCQEHEIDVVSDVEDDEPDVEVASEAKEEPEPDLVPAAKTVLGEEPDLEVHATTFADGVDGGQSAGSSREREGEGDIDVRITIEPEEPPSFEFSSRCEESVLPAAG